MTVENNIKTLKEKIINIDRLFKIVTDKKDSSLVLSKEREKQQSLIKIINKQKLDIENNINKVDFLTSKLRSTEAFNYQLKAQVNELEEKTKNTKGTTTSPAKETAQNKKEKQTILELKAKAQELEKENKRLLKETLKVQKLTNEIKKKEELINKLENKELENIKLKELNLRLEQLNKKEEEQNTIIISLKEEAEKLRKNVNSLNTNVKNKDYKIVQFEEKTQQNETIIKELKAKLSQFEEKIGLENNKRDKKIHDLSELLSQKNSLIDTLNHTLSEREGNIKKLNEEMINHQNEKPQANQNIDKLNAYKIKNKQMEETIKELQLQIEKISTPARELQCSNIDNNEKMVNLLYCEIEKLSLQKKALQDALTDNLVQLQLLNSQNKPYHFIPPNNNLNNVYNASISIKDFNSEKLHTSSVDFIDTSRNNTTPQSYLSPISKNIPNQISGINSKQSKPAILSQSSSTTSVQPDKTSSKPTSINTISTTKALNNHQSHNTLTLALQKTEAVQALENKSMKKISSPSTITTSTTKTLNNHQFHNTSTLALQKTEAVQALENKRMKKISSPSTNAISLPQKDPKKSSKPKKIMLLSSEQLDSTLKIVSENNKQKCSLSKNTKNVSKMQKKKTKTMPLEHRLPFQDIHKKCVNGSSTHNQNIKSMSQDSSNTKNIGDQLNSIKENITLHSAQAINSLNNNQTVQHNANLESSTKEVAYTQPNPAVNKDGNLPNISKYIEAENLIFVDTVMCFSHCDLKENLLTGINFLNKPYDKPYCSVSFCNYEKLLNTQKKLEQTVCGLVEILMNPDIPIVWLPPTKLPRVFTIYHDDLNSIDNTSVVKDHQNNISKIKLDRTLLHTIRIALNSANMTFFENSIVCFILLLSVQFSKTDIIGEFVNQLSRAIFSDGENISEGRKPSLVCSACRVTGQLLAIQDNKPRVLVFCYDMLVWFVDEQYLLSGMASIAQMYPQSLTINNSAPLALEEEYLVRCYKSILAGVYEYILELNKNNEAEKMANAFYSVLRSSCNWEPHQSTEYIDNLEEEIKQKISQSKDYDKFVFERCLYLISIYYTKKQDASNS